MTADAAGGAGQDHRPPVEQSLSRGVARSRRTAERVSANCPARIAHHRLGVAARERLEQRLVRGQDAPVVRRRILRASRRLPIVITAWSTGASASQAPRGSGWRRARRARGGTRCRARRAARSTRPPAGTPRTPRAPVRRRRAAAARGAPPTTRARAARRAGRRGLGAEADGGHAPVRPRLDEALALQHLERAAHGAAADRAARRRAAPRRAACPRRAPPSTIASRSTRATRPE